MATFTSSTFGLISGRHGTAVAAVTKDGKNILRIHRKPTNPNTAKQLAHREKFGLVNQSMTPLRQIVREGYNDSSGFRKACGDAIRNAVIETPEGIKIDFSKVKIAGGELQDLLSASTTKQEDGLSYQFDWDTTIGFQSREGNLNDDVHIVIFDETSGLSIRFDSVAERKAGTAKITIPEIWKGKKLHAWLYLSDKSNLYHSGSYYLPIE